MTFATADLYDDYGDKLTVLRPQFRHFGARKSFGGTVLTLKVFEDNSLVKSLLATPGQGRVLVVDGGESLRYALLGDNLAASAVKNGWSGLVIAGAIRDAALISEMDLGVYAMGTNPRKTKKQNRGDEHLTIEIAGAEVKSGMWIWVDEDGAVLLPEPPPNDAA